MIQIILQKNISASHLAWLQEVWFMLTYQLKIPKEAAQKIFAIIKKRYGESHRRYHNLAHIYSLLMLAEERHDQIEDPILFELCIWFHDLIYSPLSSNNEKESADEAVELLSPYLDMVQLDRLRIMIESTQKHVPMIASDDLKLFLDMDLAILATDKKTYQQYTHEIRKEFDIFPDMIYKVGRRKVLKRFLKKSNIYFTKYFFEKYEAIARENIAEELENL